MDLAPDGLENARSRAEALLKEHASCEAVELWRDGGLVEKIVRGGDEAARP